MITISGTASTPLTTAPSTSAFTGLTPSAGQRCAGESRRGDHCVEETRVSRLRVEAVRQGPTISVSRIGRGAGEHRHGQKPGSDDAHGEQREGEVVRRPAARASAA